SLIEKLKCEINESKYRNKFLETSNKVLIDKLNSEIKDFKNKNNSLELLNNQFKEANNKLSKENDLLYADFKKSQAELKRRKSIEYASKMELECAKVRAPESDEVIRLEKESRLKLSDLIKPFDYNKLNNLYDCRINAGLDLFLERLNEEIVVDLRYFNSLELEVDSLTSQLETQRTQFVNEIDRLSRECYYANHMHAIIGVHTKLDEVTNLQCDYLELLEKCEGLETELSKSKMMSKSFESVQKYAINLELELQQCKEKIKDDMSFKVNKSKDFCKEREQYFEIQDLKAQLQDKGIVISELNLNSKTLNVKSVSMYDKCVLHDKRDMCVRTSFTKPIKRTVASESNKKPRNSTRKIYEHFSKTCSWWYPKFTPSGYIWKPKSRTEKVNLNLIEIVLFIVDSGCLKHMTRNLKLLINFVEKFLGTGNDLLLGSRGTDLYSIMLQDTNSPNPICLVAKATSSQAWLWHRRLSHLNFDTINLLSKNDIVVASINGKRYVLVIVDDYPRYTWTHFLRSKDETPEVLINFLRLVQRGHQAHVGVAAQTMISAVKVPLFFWAEAIATACFTQNRSLVIPRHEKTPYHIINDQKPSVKYFYIFGSVCYIVKDGENLDKMKEKGDECIFMGYSTQSKAYRVFNKRTRVIMESIHVNFDELTQMASDQNSSVPAPECQRMASDQNSYDPAPEYRTVTTSNELDLLFSLMFDELLNGSSKFMSKSSVVSAADAPNQHQQLTQAETYAENSNSYTNCHII
nr:hypothetical protein [Tanacetum cinerariifolium]